MPSQMRIDIKVSSRFHRGQRTKFMLSKLVHPQTLAVVKTRADALNAQILEFDGKFSSIQVELIV